MNAKSFPPASDFLALIGRIDWKQVGQVTIEGLDYFLAIVKHIIMLTVAFCQASIIMWQRHSVTSKIIKMAHKAYTFTTQVALPWIITTGLWMQQVGYPTVRQSALKGYTLARATCETVSDLYCLLTARQFTTL
jgi:hypothetical protein